MTTPTVVLVTGEPGSGKTTLGLALSARLHIPFLSRDLVRSGQLATAGLWTDQLADPPPPREDAVDALADVVITASARGITCVVELVVTPNRTRALQRIEDVARVIVVLLAATDAPRRADARDRDDPIRQRSTQHHAERAAVAADVQRQFDLPTLHVRTDDGYDPSLDDIAAWIIDRTTRR